MTRFRFDHAYTKDPSGEIFKSLLGRGFLGLESSVEHPGSLVCEFIPFRARPELPNSRPNQYLEFASVRSEQKLLQRFREQNLRDPFENELYQPGYSLVASDSLEPFYERNKESLSSWEPRFVHRNYDWKEDATSRLPGWNFLSFGKLPLPLIYTWITEYEPSPTKEKMPLSPEVHPNGCVGVLGVVFRKGERINSARLEPLGKEIDDPIFWADPMSTDWAAALGNLSTKTSSFVAILLGCNDLKTFQEKARPDYETIVEGKRAFGIKLPDYSWDLLVIEDSKG